MIWRWWRGSQTASQSWLAERSWSRVRHKESSPMPSKLRHKCFSRQREQHRQILMPSWGQRREIYCPADSSCSFAPFRSIGAVLSIHRNGARQLLRRNAAEPTGLSRNYFCFAFAVWTGPALFDPVRPLGGGGSARRSGILHCLQRSRWSAALVSRPKHTAANGLRHVLDLVHRSSGGNVDGNPARAMGGQNRRK